MHPGSASADPPPHRRAYLVLAGITVLALFILGAQPFAVGLFPPPWDKLAHFLCYGAITGLLAFGLSDWHPAALLLTVASIGVLDEWHQAFLPGRSADLPDLLTDIAAALIVLLASELLRARRIGTGNVGCHPTE